MKKLLSKIVLVSLILAWSLPTLYAVAYPAETIVTGSNLLVDGSMEAPTTGSWTVYQSSLSKLSGGVSGNFLRVTQTSGVKGVAYRQQFFATFGKDTPYTVSGFARGNGTNNPSIGCSTQVYWTGTTSTQWQRFNFVLNPIPTCNGFDLTTTSSTGSYADFDEVVVVKGVASTVLTPVSRSLEFNGSTAGVRINNNATLDSLENFTTDFWVKGGTQSAGDNKGIVSKRETSGAFFSYSMNTAGTSLKLRINDGTNNQEKGLGGIVTGKWQRVTVVLNGRGTTSFCAYLNGVLDSCSTTGSVTTIANTNDLCIGRECSGTFFDGNIDDVRIYSRAFSASEVSMLSNTAFRNGLILEQLFNSPSGNTAYDTSGNNNNGTITGATIVNDTPPNGYAGTPLQTATVGGVARSMIGVPSSTVGIYHDAFSFVTSTGEFSMVTNFKWGGSLSQSVGQFIIANSTDDTNKTGIVLSLPSQLLVGGFRFGGTQVRVVSNSTIQPNVWYQAVYTVSSGVSKLYLNSTLQNGSGGGFSPVSTYGFTIGRRTDANPSNGTSFGGLIDNTRLYNRALSASEISAMYNQKIIPRNGLVGEWLMDNDFKDSSGSGNDGIGTNTTFSNDVPN
jgi:hypothetical protein